VLPAQVDGVVQRDAVVLLRCFRHELPEYADAAMPEDGLGQSAHHAPRSRLGVVGFQDIREFKRVIIAPGDIELPAEHGHAPPHVNLQWEINAHSTEHGGLCPIGQTAKVSGAVLQPRARTGLSARRLRCGSEPALPRHREETESSRFAQLVRAGLNARLRNHRPGLFSSRRL